ncbi:MAG: glutamate synthase subunit beta [Planctomycetaceae bacterium]|jgi:glutamate synthase (NADPH/NADH) small chain|nr:glutamate synthase subunit beta [Planctomycetaceae bacterium]
MKKTLYSRVFETPRLETAYQPVAERVKHYNEFRIPFTSVEIEEQAGRCMTCGIPFCHNSGCPLGNPIPETNTLVAEGRLREACDLLHAYDNFPEVTGRICPALCECSCVHNIVGEPVSIRQLELEIVERGWVEGWVKPRAAENLTGKRVAVIGSGPAGLAAAQQLTRLGHNVTVYEKSDAPGGIMRYGIPDFKLEKTVLDRRISQLVSEGVKFELNVAVGDDISPQFLRRKYDAVLLAGGAMEPRDIDVSGRELGQIYFAMDYLIASNISVKSTRPDEIPTPPPINAQGKKVVILGGGDTGADCLGVALRQGAAAVTQLEIMPKPPEGSNPATPWPKWQQILRTGTSHKEGGERRWSTATKKFLSEKGRLVGVEVVEVDWKGGKPVEVAGTVSRVRCDLVLLALGFVHPKHDTLLKSLGVELDARGNVKVDNISKMTNIPGIFAAGDMSSGASLIVRAINSGREAATGINNFLSQYTTDK